MRSKSARRPRRTASGELRSSVPIWNPDEKLRPALVRPVQGDEGEGAFALVLYGLERHDELLAPIGLALI